MRYKEPTRGEQQDPAFLSKICRDMFLQDLVFNDAHPSLVFTMELSLNTEALYTIHYESTLKFTENQSTDTDPLPHFYIVVDISAKEAW